VFDAHSGHGVCHQRIVSHSDRPRDSVTARLRVAAWAWRRQRWWSWRDRL